MSGFTNTKADMGFLKKRLDQAIAAGEKLIGSEFWMVFKGYEDLSILILTTQIPEQSRQDVEVTLPGGLTINQHGAYKNNGEMQVTCVETITGRVLAVVKELVRNKKYIDITISAAAESNSGDSAGLTRELGHCKVYSDAVDLSSEDSTSAVRPSLRIVYNWVD